MRYVLYSPVNCARNKGFEFKLCNFFLVSSSFKKFNHYLILRLNEFFVVISKLIV